jgi:mannose/fructose/N-acetylgalactosamine-specific phosphotransferase system component IIC
LPAEELDVDTELLLLALLGAVLGLDVVSFPQAMTSRPIVGATLAGAVVGNAGGGLIAGVVLELIALDTLPVGASRYPEWGSASVVGGALFAGSPHEWAGALALATLAALATSWIGGWSMYLLRRVNGAWARRSLPALDRGRPNAVIGLQLSGLAADFVRGGVLTFIALAALLPLVRWLAPLWELNAATTRALTVAIATAVSAGAAWRLFHGTSGARPLFLGGLAVGLAVLLAR